MAKLRKNNSNRKPPTEYKMKRNNLDYCCVLWHCWPDVEYNFGAGRIKRVSAISEIKGIGLQLNWNSSCFSEYAGASKVGHKS